MEFINREKDIIYLENHFKSEPNSLLFVYGPKSSGKSTLLEKVAKDLDHEEYAVNFLDLRQVIIYNFKTFLDVFFQESIQEKGKDILRGLTINAGFFNIKLDEKSMLKKNPFKVMGDKLRAAKNSGIQPIIIIDEIQLLKNIYINDERYLIDELFNLFIALTKVRHLAHIVLATSDSYFIEEIYNSAKLSKTSKFFILDHFQKQDVCIWLEKQDFSEKEIETVWDYLGGCPWEISEIIEEKRQGNDIKQACLSLIDNEYSKIFNLMLYYKKEKKDSFLEVITEIVSHNFCEITKVENRFIVLELLKEMIANDIWFYIANKRKIIANSKSIYHAFKKLLVHGL